MLIQQRFAVAASLAFLLGACALGVRGADPVGGAHDDLVQATLLADADALTPGGTVTLGVRMKLKPHWHTYWINPGEAGDATKIKLTGPAGMTFGEIRWPLPRKIDAPGGFAYGYEDDVLLMVPVTLPAGAPAAGGEVKIDADVSWLVCKEECIKGGAKLSISLPVSASAGQPANRELFDAWRARLPVAADDKAVAGVLEKVEQPAADASGNRPARLLVKWKKAPQKVEWFPVATRSVAIDNVKVSNEGQATQIDFEPTVYKPEGVPGGRVDGVLVFEDAGGKRVGVAAPVVVPVEPAGE
jgi:DsbC/DsbD-like thiol-disulfide interchange protein